MSLEGESAIIELSNGPIKFCSTLVKPYYDPAIVGIDINADEGIGNSLSENGDIFEDRNIISAHVPPDVSSSSAPSTSLAPPALFVPIKHWHGRLRKYPKQVNLVISPNICFVIDNPEDADFNLKLLQFTLSRQKEISGLLEKEVFKLVKPKDVPADARVFNSQFVDKIKNAGIDKAFEKSCLVIQACNDLNKDLVLTQSPTIQQVSQCFIVCFAATLQDNTTKLYLRNVIQAYVNQLQI